MPTARVRENPAQAKLERGTLKSSLKGLGQTTRQSIIETGCPILNFALFAKFRVGTLSGPPRPPALKSSFEG
jgi:hypothetical protein